jgi:predicted MFS family arabinose efflux permease
LYMTNELHFTLSQAGMVMGSYGVGSIVGSYVGGWLSDRYNVTSVMFASLMLSGLLLFLILFITSPISLGILLFVYALTADSFRPANSVAISTNSSPDNLTRSFSLVRLAVNLGFCVAPALGGIFAAKYGYHRLFVIDAITSIVAAFVLLRVMGNAKQSQISKPKTTEQFTSISAYQDKNYILFIIFVALYGMCFFQLFASAPIFFQRQLHYSPDVIGWLLALNGLLVVLIEMPLISKLEKQKSNSRYIIVGCLCNAIAFLLLAISPGWIALSIAYTLFVTLSEIFAMPFMMTHATQTPHPERRGQYSALYSIAFAVSNICAPLIGLTLASHIGFSAMYFTIVGLSLICAAGFYVVLQKNVKE